MNTSKFKINVKSACKARGIENAFQLWERIGGSKATAAQLFKGKSTMIRTATMDKLLELGIYPNEYIIPEAR